MISQRRLRISYISADFALTSVAWFIYMILRFRFGAVRGFDYLWQFMTSGGVILSMIYVPLSMVAVHTLSGYYNEVFRRSRIEEFFVTLGACVANTFLVLLVVLINDLQANRTGNYELLFLLLGLLFVFTYTGRLMITNKVSKLIRTHRLSFRTLIVGCGVKAERFVCRMQTMRHTQGFHIVGFVPMPHEGACVVNGPIFPYKDLEHVITNERIDELIVVPSQDQGQQVLSVVNYLYRFGLPVKMTPERFNALQIKLPLSNIIGEPLVDLTANGMNSTQLNIKRLLDVVTSLMVLILLSPILLAVAVMIKRNSPGPVLFFQERVGKHNKPFKIIKFRTMYVDAESDGCPRLSSENDERVTTVGRILRRYRIDELPQFWNVLRGDMSIVGPRPERQYYVDQIAQRQPAYHLLHRLKPGITSLGMVRFGYAQNIDQMVDRADYDLFYLENMSLMTDFKILLYTIKIIVSGSGM